MKFVTRYWQKPVANVPLYLKGLAGMFSFLSRLRCRYYRQFPNKVYRSSVPIIVVGNIYIGGTGKTPLVIYIANFLKNNNYNVGIISRGYGGKHTNWPVEVFSNSDARQVGDEPVLIAQNTNTVVAVGPKRSDNIKFLLAKYPKIDFIISDDGLQHYAMARDLEIIVIDANRKFGNGLLLPAGPLRESVDRINTVDFCIFNGGEADVLLPNSHQMQLSTNDVYNYRDYNDRCELTVFAWQKVHAVAGIGNPSRFFDLLTSHNIEVIEHSFPDHHYFSDNELQFNDDLPILMTEKDAVKCQHLKLNQCWVIPVQAIMSKAFESRFLEKISKLTKK